MFPFDLDDEEVNPSIEADADPTDYEIDFKTGRLTGRIITRLDAVKQWAVLALTTARYRFSQYSWNYGSELEDLIGQTYDKEYIDAEAKQMVRDALSPCKDITSVDNIECKIDGDRLTLSCTISTPYGEEEINV